MKIAIEREIAMLNLVIHDGYRAGPQLTGRVAIVTLITRLGGFRLQCEETEMFDTASCMYPRIAGDHNGVLLKSHGEQRVYLHKSGHRRTHRIRRGYRCGRAVVKPVEFP